jgi:hypothetical protein
MFSDPLAQSAERQAQLLSADRAVIEAEWEAGVKQPSGARVTTC